MLNLNLTKLKPYAKSFILGGVLLFGLLVYFIIRTLTPGDQEPKRVEYRPTIPPYTGKKLTQAPTFDEEIAKIKNFLPHRGTDFMIEYLPANVVIIKVSSQTKEDYLKAKVDAEAFIKSKGVENICTLKIFWLSENETVRETLTAQEITTTNCPR